MAAADPQKTLDKLVMEFEAVQAQWSDPAHFPYVDWLNVEFARRQVMIFMAANPKLIPPPEE
jgi:hypothetical protein